MFSSMRRSSGALFVLSVLSVLVFLPSVAHAQAAITGVAKDASGGVLPGVTVEAASPALIEKVRSVVTDDTGQYRIVDLRPGTYSVTFTLPGFSTVKREGIELTGSFVATVNGDLKVGALEETITVTGETPVVDVQSVKVQQTVSNDIIRAIPSSRSAGGIQAVIPGMSGGGDSGGITGGGGSAGTIHGGRGSDSRTYNDGLNIGWAGGGGGQWGNMVNVAAAQELVLSTSGGLGEAETSGVILNAIPREGGNTFSGSIVGNGANSAMQGSNYTDSLKAQGLKAPSQLNNLYEVNPMGGGRIVRDRLWFYSSYRHIATENLAPGMWVNKNAGNPNAWTVDFDKSKQAVSETLDRILTGRVTWQATPRNKLNFSWQEQIYHRNWKGGGDATTTIEATNRDWFEPSRMQGITWSSPLTSRLLAEAGWGTYESRYRNPAPRVDGTFNPRMIRLNTQDGEIPGLISRMPAGVGGGFNHHLIGTKANNRASLSFVTGSHNMKVGYQGGFNNPNQTYQYFNEVILVRMNGGAPNQLTQVITTNDSPARIKVTRNLWPTSFYGQDQWTHDRLTLQGGVRYDHYLMNYPESRIGGPGYTAAAAKEIVYPARSTQGISWNDVTPRMGVAYDVFGNGKTAIKFNLGKYMQAAPATNTDLDLNPIIRTAISTTRTWTDSNHDFVVNCDLSNPAAQGECAAMNNKNLGKEVFDRTYDPSFIDGWGVRPYSWSLGLSVQQEVAPRVSVNVGYYRNWWGNWYTVDNLANQTSDWTQFSITAPVDSRLPGNGGQVINGLYDLNLNKVGQVNEWATNSNNYAKQIENWQGIDVGVVARLRSGLTVQGGTSTGRKLADSCALRALVPEQGQGSRGSTTSITGTAGSPTNPYCRQVEPYLTSVRGLATYTIPKIGLQVSGTLRNDPGDSLAANFVATNAYIASNGTLGRSLSGGANITVNLIEPNTLFSDRRNNIDLRIAKIFRYGRTRTQLGVDVYNLTNTDVVTSFNQTFNPANTTWLTPTGIQPARYAKISAQFDF